MKYSTIENQLETDGFVLMLSVGTSMRPLISQRQEQLMIVKITEPLQPDDIVLFKRSNGQYVLHRIVCCEDDRYVIRGDNCYSDEIVLPHQIIGILEGFYKGRKYISCKHNGWYFCYVKLWQITYPVRKLFNRIRCRLTEERSRQRG